MREHRAAHVLPAALPAVQREVSQALVRALADVDGVVAVALGGSYARGTPKPDSDVDLGLYYREAAPFAIAAIRGVAAHANPGPAPVVTDFYEWGPWMNGGAWIRSRAGRLDLIYRNLDQVDRVIGEAQAGESAWDYAQTPTHGFHATSYLAEIAICVPLHDPNGLLAARKRQVAAYPAALKRRLVQRNLWGAEFTLRFLKTFAGRGDVYNAMGCMTRLAAHLTQALFALNETYFLNDKSALDEIEGFEIRPDEYAEAITRILAHPGETPSTLLQSADRVEVLFRAVAALAGDAYRAPYPDP
ncbi:MAG: nucleotidyltransferase domain-containing protein [Deltaproteobacteria bacterium]|nr:MAG: nucleotidyltransferase domain-containing protein [Deltaproteobacteria bacterium]